MKFSIRILHPSDRYPLLNLLLEHEIHFNWSRSSMSHQYQFHACILKTSYTSIFRDLKQLWCQKSHPGINLRPATLLIWLILDVPLQQDLELLELLGDRGRAPQVKVLSLRCSLSLEALVVPIQGFPSQAYLRNISRLELMVRVTPEI